MLALDARGARAASELISLFDLAGDAARFARKGNTAVWVIETNASKNTSTTFAAADEEALAPTEGGGPLALPVEGFCRARGLRPRLVETLRRVASIASQRCCPTDQGRRAIAAMAMAPGTPLCAVKCFAAFLSRGLGPTRWSPATPATVARLDGASASAERLWDFVLRGAAKGCERLTF